ncbi:HAMP domain-containing sensor histidine kinase [Colwellia sp. 4_MG-2023]|uniref:sensor histidine kinase n=1 Tax=unclassified Colwellia TaxID=196834 RepID=UPI001C09EB1D|nr:MULTISPECIES: HAMP domain-containing sensor histidine kinase [unclassified Colwellia]MBU2923750.1 HAMP domain-containing histidine kinase [Colwellia sp. C2M11]MDO6486335.1 HAMP domain-containing sensor histidine kinase [Colwellia sp. 6_MG-2023]MDO6505727.1 HAMP domain-containing sensor histidine kinase [Colwellia sp. 5_MG-2023]MDO6554408.1 HAMP domain-containing sensor histidine kinase [Colwellia sp. 4_MG-2023]MDO6652150.1 HAMP domain-containing sensor histidine kinase [Colwellia sp. 3_MG-2
MESRIRTVIEAVSNTYGDDFFNSITLALHEVINADHTFIAVLDPKKSTSRTIALVSKGEIANNFEYTLKDTPCADVADNSVCYYRGGVCELFPQDKLLKEMNIDAYIGSPLYDSKQRTIGIIVSLYEKSLENEQDVLTLFKVFSGRIAAELERKNYEDELENTILSRTLELSQTVDKLKNAQKQLVESDKMAALGGLVAGISHEVNTPLGIAITTHSIIAEKHKKLLEKVAKKSLSIKNMNDYCESVSRALNMQEDNLFRAKRLIENFKQTAVDQHHLEIDTINIKNYYKKLITTLNSILRTKNVTLTITGDDDINIATYPGIHAQILTNLITNSVRHGFNNKENNRIVIDISKKHDTVEINYHDNGIGLSEEVKKHIFDPFFTTARQDGGVGLGMSIIYNLITQTLKGDILIDNIDTGAGFTYHFTTST